MSQQTSGPFPGYCLGGSSSILPGTPAYGAGSCLGGSAASVGASAASLHANPYQPGPSPYAQTAAAMQGAIPQGFAPNAPGQPPIVNPVLGGSFSAPVGAPIGGSAMCRALGGSFTAPPGGTNGVTPQIYHAPPYYVGLPPQLGGSMSALPGAPLVYGQPGAASYPGTFSTSPFAGIPQIQNGTPNPHGAHPPSATVVPGAAPAVPSVGGAPAVPGAPVAPDAARAAGNQGSQYPDAPYVITEAEFKEYEMLRAMAYGGENGGQVQPMVARRTKTACC